MIVGICGDETFTKIGDQLRRGNSYAGALILVCTDEGPDEKTVLYAAAAAGSDPDRLPVAGSRDAAGPSHVMCET